METRSDLYGTSKSIPGESMIYMQKTPMISFFKNSTNRKKKTGKVHKGNSQEENTSRHMKTIWPHYHGVQMKIMPYHILFARGAN